MGKPQVLGSKLEAWEITTTKEFRDRHRWEMAAYKTHLKGLTCEPPPRSTISQ